MSAVVGFIVAFLVILAFIYLTKSEEFMFTLGSKTIYVSTSTMSNTSSMS